MTSRDSPSLRGPHESRRALPFVASWSGCDLRRRFGKPDRHAGAPGAEAFQDELAAVEHDDLPGERQAEAQSAGTGRVERADLAGVVAREAGAVVLDVD